MNISTIKSIITYLIMIPLIIASTNQLLKTINISEINKTDEIAITEYEEALLYASKKIKTKPEYLYKVIYIESKHNHKAINSKSNAYGLIQLMETTLKDMNKNVINFDMTLNELKALNRIEQVEEVIIPYFSLVKKRRKIKRFDTLEDCYFAVFYPIAINKPYEFVLGSEKNNERIKKIARQNSLYDTNKDNKITKQEVADYLNNFDFPKDKKTLLNL